MKLTTSDFDTFSVSTTLSVGDGSMNVPMAQGMGFVTAEYDNLTPSIHSQVSFKSLDKADSGKCADGIQKYVAKLGNDATWNIYVTAPNGQSVDLKLDSSSQTITSDNKATGVVIQAIVLPQDISSDDSQDQIDASAGMYPVGVSVDGSVSNDVATYTINYNTTGTSASGSTWLWALPHHVESFTDGMKSQLSKLTVASTAKGLMTGVNANKLEMAETMYTSLQWLPWTEKNTNPTFSDDELNLIRQAAQNELKQNMSQQVDIASTYTAGKAFDKYAYIALVASDVLKDDKLTDFALEELKKAISIYTSNSQPYPLMYDTKFKGVTSTASIIENDPNADFGGSYYNDHHFHYGYYVHTAAVIGYLDNKKGGSWVNDNKEWVNSLIRDVANPSHDDSKFPVFRMYDWFSGHSWAAGLFPSAAGKNEESTSEDYNFAYGMKLWGNVVNDKDMEARGDLMLSVTKRSMNNYFYMEDDNVNQPKNFIKNKVPGITFDNQMDHTTYFGTNLEYIQGIHMIPITPVSSLIRTPTFVQQEWEQKLASMIDSVQSGWTGILRSNQAIYDAKSAYDFFSSSDFKDEYLDGGASKTWYLAYSAGMKSLQS